MHAGWVDLSTLCHHYEDTYCLVPMRRLTDKKFGLASNDEIIIRGAARNTHGYGPYSMPGKDVPATMYTQLEELRPVLSYVMLDAHTIKISWTSLLFYDLDTDFAMHYEIWWDQGNNKFVKLT